MQIALALQIQLRVIAALILRETRATFGTSRAGYLWAIVTPAAGVTILVIIFTAIGRHPPFGESFALFFTTGLLTLELFKKLSNSLMTVFEANKALLTYPPIREPDVLFARAALIGITYALIMGIFFSGLFAVGLAGFPAHPFDLMTAFFVTFLLGLGFGATNSVLISLWPSWRHVVSIITRPLFILSAIFYVPSNMPPQIVTVLKWNPALHAVEWMRNGYYSNYDSRVLDKTYILFMAVTLLFFGLFGERLTRNIRGGS